MAAPYIPTRQERRAALREKVMREYPLLSDFLYPARIPAMQHPTSWPTHADMPEYLVNNTGSEDLMLPHEDEQFLLDDLMEDHYAHIATERIYTASDTIVGYGRGSATVEGTAYPDVPGSVLAAIQNGATRGEVRRMYESIARRLDQQPQQQQQEQPRREFPFPSTAALDVLMAQGAQPQVPAPPPPPPAPPPPPGPAQPAPTHWNGMRILATNQPALDDAARHAAANHQPSPHGGSSAMYGPSAWEQRQVNRLRELGFAMYREQAGIVEDEDEEAKEFNELVAEYKRNLVWCCQKGICLREGFVAKVMKMDKKKGMQKKKKQQQKKGVSGGRVEKKAKKNNDKKSACGASSGGKKGVVMGSLVIRTKKEN